MDAMVKATQAGITPAASRVIWDRLGFTPDEQRVMEQEMRRREAAERMGVFAQAGEAGGEAVAAARANRPPESGGHDAP